MDKSNYAELMQFVGDAVDGIGVFLILGGALIATFAFVLRLRRMPFPDSYKSYRQGLGRAILVGLEFMVAGDIIRTVAVTPTLRNVAILGVIVLIRTFLSFALEVELEGHWPWQRPQVTPNK